MDRWAWEEVTNKEILLLSAFAKRVLLNAELLHALNQEEADSIQTIVPSKTLLIQPNGIDIDLFKRAEYDKAKRSRLLFLGRLDPKKSVLELIRVWKVLVNETPEFSWELEIAGSGHPKYEAQLKAEAGALIGEGIYFTGHVSGEKKVHCF